MGNSCWSGPRRLRTRAGFAAPDPVTSDGSSDRRVETRRYWRWLGLNTAGGAALRFFDLGGISIWGDELFEGREALRLAQLADAGIRPVRQVSINGPLSTLRFRPT